MADTTIDLLKNSSYVGKMDELIAAVKLGGSATSDVEWNNVKNKPTTIGGYGITDAKIDNGTITLGANSITPLTSAPVNSVNSKTGAVVLNAADVGALPNTTTIPDKTSQLDNDSGYITNSTLTDYAKKTEIPTKTSELTNDSGYITNTALEPYAKTVDVPTKTSQLTNDSNYITAAQAPVQSVNNKTGAVTLSAADVSAIPSTLTGTAGQVLTKTADGQEWKDVEIPSGGSGKAKTQKLIDITFTEPTASLSVTLEHNFCKLFLVWSCGSDGAARIVDADGKSVSGKLGVCLDTTSFTWNDRKIAQIDSNTSTWLNTASLIEYTDDLSTLLRSTIFDIKTGTNGSMNSSFGGYLAMIGTLGNNALSPTAGRTVNIVTSSGFFAATTRIILVGEYYE